MVFSNTKELWGLFSLTVFAGFFLFWGLGVAPLVDWDENAYAEASRQMLERQDYLNIYVNDHPFAEKPPFFFWEQALSYHVLGINEFGARFPSAVAGLLSVWLCFFLGKKVKSLELGMLWGLIYLTSFLPALLARSAVIDHTFNFFIMLSAYSLYSYDVRYGQYLSLKKVPQKKVKASYWVFLIVASLSMGLSVLAKGPLGGCIPLVGYGSYKLFYRTPKINWVHFFCCALLSLGVAFSWYIANWWVHGGRFIEEFIQFQQSLFSKPSEGHHGPFYYHFVIALVGFLPWTPFLFLFRFQNFPKDQPHLRPLLFIAIGWVSFVLLLFSIVTTKLPHYSASIYIPLSFVVALGLERTLNNQGTVPRWIIGIYFLFGTFLSGVLVAFPWALEQFFKSQNTALALQETMELYFIYFIGIGFFLGIMAGSFFFWKKKIWIAVWVTAMVMFINTQGLWRVHVPMYLQYVQQPLLNLVQKAHQNEGKVVLYRYVSFAAVFYEKRPVEMLHTKFPGGSPEMLDQRPTTDLFIITETKNKNDLQKNHPLVEFVEDQGLFSLFLLSSAEKAPQLPQ